jgi:hypothetical protein
MSDKAARALSLQQAEALHNSILTNQNLQNLLNQEANELHLEEMSSLCDHSRQLVPFEARDADMHSLRNLKCKIFAVHANATNLKAVAPSSFMKVVKVQKRKRTLLLTKKPAGAAANV